MIQYNPLEYLPTSEELPCSDETPVDNELQNLVPNFLLGILAFAWENRMDWFFGVDMGIYYHPRQPAIIPDGFLSLNVERRKVRSKGREGRLSYVLWEENGTLPILVLEVVSQTYNEEYGQKKIDYAELGILYYVIYDSERHHSRRGEPFEVHRLVDGEYVRCFGEPVWMPEIGLGIGRELGTFWGWQREWLYWYDADGRRFLSPDELAQQAAGAQRQAEQQAETERQRAEAERQRAEAERQRAEAERQRAEQLAAQLRALGIEPAEG